MNRREFFKWLGKGVSLATLDPKAVTKMVVNAQTAPKAAAAMPNILGALQTIYDTQYDLYPSKSLEIIPELVKRLNGGILTIVSSLDKTKIANIRQKRVDNFSINYVSRLVKELKQFETDISLCKTGEDANSIVEDYLGNSTLLSEVIYNMSLLPEMYASNLITKDAEKYLMDVLPSYDFSTRSWEVNSYIEDTVIKAREYAKTGKWPSNEEVEKIIRKEYPERRKEEIEQEREEIEQERKDKEQEQYDQTSKDIYYSRMDKAGSAEDTDYAKYYEKVNTFDTLVEAMDRRDFLKWLSKGASVAGANPKTVGKMIMNAAGGAAASSAPVNVATISQALKKLDSLAYNLGDEGFITAANQKVIASTLKSDLLKILPAFASKGINFEMGEKGLKQLDKVLKGEMDLADTVLYSTGEPSEFNEYIPFSDALKNGFINQDFKNYYIDKYGELYYADIHFESLPESRLPWDKREEKWLEFLKKHYPETYKSEKAWRDEAEKNMYDNTAKDIDYSRMDKAGSAEDTDYAKYYEKVKTFDTLLEAMDRRGFLKMLGKGAAAAAAPKGAIAKALTNLEPTKIDAGKALLNFFDTVYNVRHHPGSLIDKYSLTVNTLSNFLLALKQTGLTTDPQLLYDLKHVIRVDSTVLKYLKKELTQQQAFDMLQKYDAVDLLDLDDSIDDYSLQSSIDNYYNILDHMDESLTPTIHQLFQHNLISPEIQSQLENKHRIYKCDYMNDPDSKARKNERRKKEREENRKDNYNNIAKYIDYSRMDKAGGAEDTDYAKYYEKVNTFDTLLEAMDRRGFLKMLGRGASIAGVSPSTVGKMAMNLANSPSPKDNFIKNWIINHYQLLNGGSGSTVQDIEGIKNSYQAILTFLTNKGLNTDWVEYKISHVENWLDDDVIKNFISEYGGDIDDYFTNFIESGTDGDADYEIYAILFKNNLIDEEMQNYLSKRGIDKRDHRTHEDEMKQQKQEEQKRKEDERKQIAKDINYSRMDKAGSAEDEGYAKYYEKVNTFDSLLSFIKEDDAFSGLELAKDVLSPEGKKVYYEYTVTQRDYVWDDDNDYINGDSTNYLPHDAIFVIPGLWYRKWGQEGTYTGTWITYYFTDKPLAIKWKNFTENWNRRHVDNIDPEMARLGKIIQNPPEHENI